MHKIHDIVEKRLKEFIESNHKIFESMLYGQILQVYKDVMVDGHRICHSEMFVSPYNIKYFGKMDGASGDVYVFLNGNMDKIYTYVDKIII